MERRALKANHLRVLFLAVNLALAATLPLVYAWSLASASGDETHPAAVDLGDYVYRPLPPPPPPDWTAIAEGHMPRRPQLPDPAPSVAATPAPSPPAAGGPLGEEWRYVFYMRTDDGSVHLVKLERIRNDPPARARPSSRSGRSPSSRARRLPGRSNARRAPESADSVVLFVRDRVVRDPALGIELLIDSADDERFDYVLPDDPGKVYSLPFEARRSRLVRRSTEKDPPAGGRHFVPSGWTSRVESEYQRWRRGEIELSEATSLSESLSGGGAGASR